MGVWTRPDWNDIIQRVNDLINSDEACRDVDPLDEVEENHIWTQDDIQQVRDKLQEICEDNEFSEELIYWKQAIIDEINEAIDQGWCDCCEICEFGHTQSWNLLFTIPARWDFVCPPLNGWPYNPACCHPPFYCHFMDWAPSIHGTVVGAPLKKRRYWRVLRLNIVTGERCQVQCFFTGNSGTIKCEDGSIDAPMDTTGWNGMGLAEPEYYALEVWAGCGSCFHKELGWIYGAEPVADVAGCEEGGGGGGGGGGPG